MIPVILSIRKNATGEIRRRDWEEDEPFNPYIWEEGNYACDCNREAWFEGPDCERSCSDHRFSIQIERKDTGAVIYSEFTHGQTPTP